MLRVQGVGDRIANSRRKITLAVRVVTHPLASRLLLLIMNERLSGIETVDSVCSRRLPCRWVARNMFAFRECPDLIGDDVCYDFFFAETSLVVPQSLEWNPCFR